MAEYIVDSTKFIILLILVSGLFFGIGFYAKTVISHADNSASTNQPSQRQALVDSLLQDVKLNNLNSRYSGFGTSILLVYTATGTFTSFKGDAMSVHLDNDGDISFIPSNFTLFVVQIGNKSTIVSQREMRPGDKIEISESADAQNKKIANSRVVIRRTAT